MTDPARITPAKIVHVFARLAFAYLYYPVIIGLAIWMWIKQVHVGWGLALLAVVWVYDPMLRILRARIRHARRRAKK